MRLGKIHIYIYCYELFPQSDVACDKHSSSPYRHKPQEITISNSQTFPIGSIERDTHAKVEDQL